VGPVGDSGSHSNNAGLDRYGRVLWRAGRSGLTSTVLQSNMRRPHLPPRRCLGVFSHQHSRRRCGRLQMPGTHSDYTHATYRSMQRHAGLSTTLHSHFPMERRREGTGHATELEAFRQMASPLIRHRQTRCQCAGASSPDLRATRRQVCAGRRPPLLLGRSACLVSCWRLGPSSVFAPCVTEFIRTESSIAQMMVHIMVSRFSQRRMLGDSQADSSCHFHLSISMNLKVLARAQHSCIAAGSLLILSTNTGC